MIDRSGTRGGRTATFFDERQPNVVLEGEGDPDGLPSYRSDWASLDSTSWGSTLYTDSVPPHGVPVTSEDAQFRITTWPPGPVTPLPVRRFTADLVEDGSIEWFPAAGESLVNLPPEMILRELQDLDLDSPEDVMQFVRDYGPIQRSFKLFGLQPDYGFDKPLARSYIWNHIVDVAMYLRTMRAMVNHWLADLEGDDPADAWRAESSPSLELRYPAHPWERFAGAMSEGLDVYRVRVEYTIPLESGPIIRHAPEPDLFSAMCLQLFNLMSEDLPVRRCANETCGRRFFRQMGRAEYGQYRSEGVRFCSKSCAKSQVQREYRRRKTEAS